MIEEGPKCRIRSLAPATPRPQQVHSSEAAGSVNGAVMNGLQPSVQQVKQRQRRLLEKVHILHSCIQSTFADSFCQSGLAFFHGKLGRHSWLKKNLNIVFVRWLWRLPPLNREILLKQ